MKEIKDLTIADDFMFCYIMTHYRKICKKVIECILDIKIKELRTVVQQKKEKEFFAKKAVIFDIFADDGDIYEIEMQNISNGDEIKRLRLYQAALDMGQLQKGKTYNDLKNVFIIFICNFDPIGDDEPIYEIKKVFAHSGKEIDDGVHSYFLNAKAFLKVKNKELKALLQYIRTKEITSDLTQQIDEAVENQKYREVFKEEYMSLMMLKMDAIEQGRAEGRAQGRAEGRAEGIAWQKAQSDTMLSQMSAENARLVAEIARLKAKCGM